MNEEAKTGRKRERKKKEKFRTRREYEEKMTYKLVKLARLFRSAKRGVELIGVDGKRVRTRACEDEEREGDGGGEHVVRKESVVKRE